MCHTASFDRPAPAWHCLLGLGPIGRAFAKPWYPSRLQCQQTCHHRLSISTDERSSGHLVARSRQQHGSRCLNRCWPSRRSARHRAFAYSTFCLQHLSSGRPLNHIWSFAGRCRLSAEVSRHSDPTSCWDTSELEAISRQLLRLHQQEAHVIFPHTTLTALQGPLPPGQREHHRCGCLPGLHQQQQARAHRRPRWGQPSCCVLWRRRQLSCCALWRPARGRYGSGPGCGGAAAALPAQHVIQTDRAQLQRNGRGRTADRPCQCAAGGGMT